MSRLLATLRGLFSSSSSGPSTRRTLKTFSGVFCPVALSQFSTVLFLRTGFIAGQAGLLLSLAQLFMAYAILFMTVLSVCAISTNGEIQSGGVYFMISRTLGPEFGGSIGLLFYLANVFSCALYVSGFVEGLVDNFGPDGKLISGVLHGDGKWWTYLYGTGVALFCLLICLVGGSLFAKMSLIILIVVLVCLASGYATFLFKTAFAVAIPRLNKLVYNEHVPPNVTIYANFTGLSMETFEDNLSPAYYQDYSSSDLTSVMTFASVFAVLFSGVTGIMNGANMSGELENPSYSIPRGTLAATCFTLICYIFNFLLTTASCSRELLHDNYLYMQFVGLVPILIVIGIFATTLSAALGNLMGGSRILEALARDEIFGVLLRPFKKTIRNNPLPSVLISYVLVQGVMLIGNLNAIAPAVSVFFLLAYASVNLACAALDVASSSNFRPTFKWFSWHTSLLGLAGCLAMCFVISTIYAMVALLLLIGLVVALHFRDFEDTWGSISQALLFHQVRKYLLMLDSRKYHVKYWRPQVLLLVANPRSDAYLVQFVNDLKKGGLYVIGHVITKDLDELKADPTTTLHSRWLSYVDFLHVKAFVEVTLSRNIRQGLHHLCRVSGLGGMKPHTVCMGFYDDHPPLDFLRIIKREQETKKMTRLFQSDTFRESSPLLDTETSVDFSTYSQTSANQRGTDFSFLQALPPLRHSAAGEEFPSSDQASQTITNTITASQDGRNIVNERISPEDYVRMIEDVLKMEKNVCLFRNFTTDLHKHGGKRGVAQSKWKHSQPPVASDTASLNSAYQQESFSTPTSSGRSTASASGVSGNAVLLDTLPPPLQGHTSPRTHIDIWPFNFFQPESSGHTMDQTCLFMLQLACVLGMAPAWRDSLLRVFICADAHHGDVTTMRRQLNQLLAGVRIQAEIHVVSWDDIVMQLEQSGRHRVSSTTGSIIEISNSNNSQSDALSMSLFETGMPDHYLEQVNQLIASHSMDTAVVFLYLPRPPTEGRLRYLQQMSILTQNLPPAVLVHGLHSVMSAAL